ncbi:MAG: MFS transporter, partial [Sporichthya sp.]|nr:MFS transporter [Sporichthya sp.]
VNTSRQLGFALGIAPLGTLFYARAQHVFEDRGIDDAAEAGRAVAGGRSGELLAQDPGLSDAIHAAAVGGVQWTLGVAGVIGLIAATIALVLIRPVKSAEPPAQAGPPTQAKPPSPSGPPKQAGPARLNGSGGQSAPTGPRRVVGAQLPPDPVPAGQWNPREN